MYVNLCCLSSCLRFCLCFRYRVFLYSDLCVYGLNMGLCGFAAKIPNVVELLSMGTSKSGASLYVTLISLSFHGCSVLV